MQFRTPRGGMINFIRREIEAAMLLKENQRLICAGQMPLRAPDGKQLAAVPVYKIVSIEDMGADPAAELESNERLVLVGTVESKITAEERYNALMTGGLAPKSCATPLYIKDTADGEEREAGLTEGEKQALNPLVADMMHEFSAAMQEKEGLKQRNKKSHKLQGAERG